MSDGCSSPRLDVYGHTLQEIEPELSTFRVDRQEGQKGQVILVFRRAKELFEVGSSRNEVALSRMKYDNRNGKNQRFDGIFPESSKRDEKIGTREK